MEGILKLMTLNKYVSATRLGFYKDVDNDDEHVTTKEYGFYYYYGNRGLIGPMFDCIYKAQI